MTRNIEILMLQTFLSVKFREKKYKIIISKMELFLLLKFNGKKKKRKGRNKLSKS